MAEYIELNACISNPETLFGTDLSNLDAVYLGQPYCLKYEGNFLLDPEEVVSAVARLHADAKRAYLTTPAIPTTTDWPLLEKVLRAAAAAGIDGVEAHDVGVFSWVRRELPGIAVHIGNFANVYNEDSAAMWERLGAARIVPSHELTGDELEIVVAGSGVDCERPVHGPLPLGMAYACLLRRNTPDGPEKPCRQQCAEPHYLELDGWRMRSVGTSLLSGEDYCLIEHLEDLAGRGLTAFRLETFFDSAGKINELSAIYRRALERARVGAAVESSQVEVLRGLALRGLCNGWHFGRNGRDYVGAGEVCVG